jgi:EAL domain-containing protein (putative c-di-GMP-specific phosphodiesterase class I)
MYQKTYKGWERFRIWMKLLYPSRSLHQFPPHFIMRDVLVEQVSNNFRSGNQCILLLFDVKRHAEMKSLYPAHVMLQIEEEIERVFRLSVPEVFSAEQVLAMQKYYDDDYVVMLKDAGWNEDQMIERLDRLKRLLEAELVARTSSFCDFPVTFHTAFARVEPREDVFEAVHYALQDARSIAKKHLPANIGHIRAQLRQIIEEENIRVLAQPIISLDSGQITGWEILTRGPVDTLFTMPEDLFHYAYQTDLLIHLELLVVKKAFMVIHQKRTTSPVYINVTVPSLKNPFFFQMVRKLLEQFPEIDPGQIVFEITERHVIDDLSAFSRSMEHFREAGFKLAVDDTGAGYASLHMIAELLPDVIKIDRSIIRNIDRHEVKDTVLDALLMVARKIGSNVVAEGIETEEEAKALLGKNVDFGQGFFFSVPLEPFPEIPENWVAKQKGGFALGT